jgi:thiamine pyrophosphokinase
LLKGSHEIHCDRAVEGPTCGLLPIGVASARVSTSGLRWNLSGTLMKFGTMVSTSNIVDAEVVHIETDAPIVWTIEVKM